MIAARISAGRPAHRVQEDPDNGVFLPPTAGEAADLLAVSKNTVEVARKVVRKGSPALQAATSEGSVPIATAARVAEKLDTEGQDAYADKVRAGADPVKAAGPGAQQCDNGPSSSGRPFGLG